MSVEFYQEYVENNKEIIYKICRAYAKSEADFQDYFQEVCFQLWKAKDKFNNSSKLSTWIYRVTLNVCLSLVRNKKNKPQKVEVKEHHLSEQTSFEIENEQEYRLSLLYEAIQKLKEIDRAIILLFLEENSYQEISEILGISVSNVGVKVNRIKTQLKKILDGKL